MVQLLLVSQVQEYSNVIFYTNKKKGNVNEYFKGIDLENIFRNFLLKKKKVNNFFQFFLIFHKNGIKTFLRLSINK